jgi:N-glycosylase/DNA lyase
VDFEGPLDLEHTLECGQAFRWRREGDWYFGPVSSYALKVRTVRGGLEVRSNPPFAEEKVRYYFRLDDDLDAILREVGVDRYIREAARKYRGLRLLRQEPWECLVSYVSSAASNIPKISRCIDKLSSGHGPRLELDGTVAFGFPEPGRLAVAGTAALRKCELGFRAPYIAGIARTIAGGKFETPEALRELPYQQAKERLMSLKGVGEKVADCVLLFSLDKLEAFPVDRWVKRAVESLFLGNRTVSEKTVREWGRAHYGRYAGYAQQYLFHYMRHLND